MINKEIFNQQYFQKTYAGWLGKNIGVQLGSPVEGWSYEKIKEQHGEITSYLLNYQDYAADDDLNGPLFFTRSLIDYAHLGSDITAREMGHTWMNYVPDKHGFFWWGGYGISTEHTAYENMQRGIEAPRSGSIAQNGHACAEQIGGQIFIDSWGFVNPGNPEGAAEYARKIASVSHDGEALHGGVFVAACVSAAYDRATLREVMEAGLKQIPADCLYARVVRDIMSFYDRDEKKDWRACFQHIKAHHGYDRYPGNCHVIPNSAVMILALLYGDGDFSATICICTMCGWDTDCNAGNVGAIMGVHVGIEQIEDKWIEPINDLLISSSVIGGLNISTISQTAERFCRQGYQLASLTPPQSWQDRQGHHHFHFDMEKSTQAIRLHSANMPVRLENSAEHAREGHRALIIKADGWERASRLQAFIKTYYRPEDLHDSRYDPAFTPVVFPGQRIRFTLRNCSGFDARVRVFARDRNNDRSYQSEPLLVRNDWVDLELLLPGADGGLIDRIGIDIDSPDSLPVSEGKSLRLVLDSYEITGSPTYSINFAKERVEHFGFSGAGPHQEISQFTYHSGLWELDGDCYSGSCSDRGESYTGFYYGRDYSLNCVLNPQLGEYHLVNFRVQGAARSYAFGFYGAGKIALLKKEQEYRVLESANFNHKLQESYEISILVSGKRFTASIDGKTVIDLTDPDCNYHYGQLGFTVLHGSHCHYRDLKITSEILRH